MFGRKKIKNNEWQIKTTQLREKSVICIAKNKNGKVGYYEEKFGVVTVYIDLTGPNQSKLMPFKNFAPHSDSNYDSYFAAGNYKIDQKELVTEAFNILGITKEDLNPKISSKWNGWMLELFNEGESNAIK